MVNVQVDVYDPAYVDASVATLNVNCTDDWPSPVLAAAL
jgi:hypothetical protein